MEPVRHAADIHLWCGNFASQQLAFAHLLDEADRFGVALDLDQVEVMIGPETNRRLAHYFETDPPHAPGPATVTLALPSGTPCPFANTGRLTYIGRFAGIVTRPAGTWV